jgi:hypothetical protein
VSNNTYKVQLIRVINDPKIGPTAMTVVVQASSDSAAKNMAESMNRGYKASRSDRQYK